jgi:hypothetical protein
MCVMRWLLGVLLCLALVSCGNDKPDIPEITGPTCKSSGAICVIDSECCSNICTTDPILTPLKTCQ